MLYENATHTVSQVLGPQSTVTVSGTSTLSVSPLTISTFPTPTVPSHIASQCQLATSTPLSVRLSSACFYISIVPSTVASTVVASTVTTTVSVVEPTSPCSSLPTPFIAPGGAAYIPHCEQYYVYSRPNLITVFDVSQVPTFELCGEACTNTPPCVAFDWVDPVPYRITDNNWFLLSSTDGGTDIGERDSAILVGYSGP